MVFINKKLSEITPYENNPRENDQAIDAVAESILQCGYIAPIIVDEDGVILAGHTRYKALSKLGRDTIPVLVADGLTDEQKRKYRLLDNKTGELSVWDFTLLPIETDGLDFGDLEYLFPAMNELDVSDEDFIKDTEITKSKNKIMKCPHCGHEFEI